MYFYIQIFQKYLPPTKCQTSFTFQFWTKKKKWSFIRKCLQIKVSIQMKAMRSYNIWEFSLILNYPNSWTVAILDNEENRMHVQSSICAACSTSCCSLFCLPWGEAIYGDTCCLRSNCSCFISVLLSIVRKHPVHEDGRTGCNRS